MAVTQLEVGRGEDARLEPAVDVDDADNQVAHDQRRAEDGAQPETEDRLAHREAVVVLRIGRQERASPSVATRSMTPRETWNPGSSIVR